jgi:Cdc6-like AAA superfamily ATPase
LREDNCIRYCKMVTTISRGYIYNSPVVDIDYIKSWYLIPMRDKLYYNSSYGHIDFQKIRKIRDPNYSINNIPKFSLDDIDFVSKPRILIIGTRGSGKTTLVDALLEKIRQVCPNNCDPFYPRADVDNIIINHPDTKLHLVIDNYTHASFCHIKDDTLRIFKNIMIIVVQTVFSIRRDLCDDLNFDYCIMFRNTQDTNIKLLYNRYCSHLLTHEHFASLMEQMKNYDCLIIKRTGEISWFHVDNPSD